jgi:ABC-2 type transport system ATP-binding protein
MNDTELAIDVKALRKVYGSVVAVDNIDLAVPQGSVTALLGGNGAGKTTTISILLGLMEPSSGAIKLWGHDFLRDPYALLPFINFSSPYVDLPIRLTVRQNLMVYGHFYGVPNVARRIDALAERLQIKPFLNRPYSALSAGQKTRVSLAKSLLNEPRLLLLDEPTASLDPDTADWVRHLLQEYQRETGATLFMASHNMQEVERMADRAIIMRQGRIVAQGAPAELIDRFGRDNLEEVFLDIARNRHA